MVSEKSQTLTDKKPDKKPELSPQLDPAKPLEVSKPEPAKQDPKTEEKPEPIKKETKEKPKKGPGRPPGKKNKSKDDIIPEYKPKKDPASIKDPYSALESLHQQRILLWEREKKIADRFEEIHGRKLFVSPNPPKHTLDGSKDIDQEQLSAQAAFSLVQGFVALPAMVGLESTPPLQAQVQLSQALSNLSRHYPQMDSKVADWFMVVTCLVWCSSPWILEIRLKRLGEWENQKAVLARSGRINLMQDIDPDEMQAKIAELESEQ